MYMKQLYLMIVSVLLITLTGCNSSEPVKTKDVEIYGTIYTIPEEWYVEKDDKSSYIYLQKEKPEKIRDALFITQIPDVISNGSTYSQSEQYINLLKGSMAKGLFDKLTGDEEYDKEETAGTHLSGEKNGFNVDAYMFMNNYTDALLIQYYHDPVNSDKDHSEEIKNVIDSMKFSYPGFTKGPASNNISSQITDSSNSSSEKELAKRVYQWCQERFDYYDKKDGYYTGDKHDDDVFEDAAEHFGKTVKEVRKLYDDGGVYTVRGE